MYLQEKKPHLQGYGFSAHWIAPDPAKVATIQDLTTLKDVSEVRSLPKKNDQFLLSFHHELCYID